MTVQSKLAIVTGATRGLGREFAKSLAAEGYDLLLTASSDKSILSAAGAFDSFTNIKVSWFAVDFSNQNQVVAFAEMLQNLPRVDVLVNNAAVYQPDQLLDEGVDFEPQFQVNFRAAYTITQSLLPLFGAQQFGHIFNVCSVVNRHPRMEAASYTISKFALYGYHQLLAQTMKPHKVKVTAFLPSSINTSSWDGVEAPKDEFVQPEDIAKLMITTLQMQFGTHVSEIELQSINPDF